MQLPFKHLLIIIIFSLNTLSASNTLWDRPYIPTEEPPLHEEFDYFSETESLECNGGIYSSPTKCIFKAKDDAHLGSIIFILVLAFFLISGLIGHNPDYQDPYSAGSMLSEKAKDEINHKPIRWKEALIVFILALFLIKYINSDRINKKFDFQNRLLTLTKARDNELIETIPFQEIELYELMKYEKKEYVHYEANIRLKNGRRIHLYANKDYISPTSSAVRLSKELNISVKKVVYSEVE